MTAFAVICGSTITADAVPIARRMMRSMGETRVDDCEIAVVPGAVLVSGVPHGSPGNGSESPNLSAAPQLHWVASNATLYYVPDLLKRMGVPSPKLQKRSASDHIADALDHFGHAAAHKLEGDFAFAAWNSGLCEVIAARDICGRRPLYYCHTGDVLVIASHLAGVLAHPAVSSAIDMVALAEMVSCIWQDGASTVYKSVRELPAGHQLFWRAGSTPRVEKFWQIPSAPTGPLLAIADAAEELRHLLVTATAERLSASGSTAVTLSGGWDSSAVFGAAHLAIKATATPPLLPVSISYPVGNAGREDEQITRICDHLGVPPNWIRSEDLRMFAGYTGAEGALPAAPAPTAADPWVHPFAEWNRGLSRESSRLGAIVMLDGFGGDQLFQVSDIFLADLIRGGRVIEARRQHRIRRGGGIRDFVKWAVLPNLPPVGARGLESVTGRNPMGWYLDRPLPWWISPSFARRHELAERSRANMPALQSRGHVLREVEFLLRNSWFSRTAAAASQMAEAQGVEIRSPLMDERIIRFAFHRPWQERANGNESKVLLRGAMRGVLPDWFLAPRNKRTGITSDYFRTSVSNDGLKIAQSVFARSVLAELGIVDTRILLRSWEKYAAGSRSDFEVAMVTALHVELWLQSSQRSGTLAA